MFYDTKIQNYNGKKLRVIKYKNTRIKSTTNQGVDRKKVSTENQEQNQRAYAYKVKRRIYDYANSNDFKWFATFTFRASFETNEERFSAMNTWLQSQSKRARRNGQEFKYIVVAELHESGLVHFHALFSDTFDLKIKERKTKTNRSKLYVSCWKNGYSDIEPIKDKEACANYVSKYITKNFFNDKKAVAKFKKRYWASHNLKRGKTAYVDSDSIDDEKQAKAIRFLTNVEQAADYKADLDNCVIYELSLNQNQKELEELIHSFEFYENTD